jgi:hypothetical protein
MKNKKERIMILKQELMLKSDVKSDIDWYQRVMQQNHDAQ